MQQFIGLFETGQRLLHLKETGIGASHIVQHAAAKSRFRLGILPGVFERIAVHPQGVAVFAVSHQIIAFLFSSHQRRLLFHLLQILLQRFLLRLVQILNFFHDRQNQLCHGCFVLQQLLQSPGQGRQPQFLFQPKDQPPIENGLIQQIEILTHIEAQFFHRVDVGADIFDEIRIFCFFRLT